VEARLPLHGVRLAAGDEERVPLLLKQHLSVWWIDGWCKYYSSPAQTSECA
jgi:hypothetical protein